MLDEARPNVVYVRAGQSGGTAKWGSFCQSTPLARIVSQTRATATVAVATYAQPLPKPQPGEGVGCPAVGLGAVRLTITLAQPLGTRRLVDAYDGAARQVLDPATVLKPTYLPDGYTGGQATWSAQPPGAAVREYRGRGASLIVTVGSAALNRHDEHSIEHTTVRGHPATVSNYRGFEQDILVAWSEDATHAVTVYQVSDYEKAHPPLTADQLVRVANGLRAAAPPPVPASMSPGEDVPALVRSKTHHALTSNTVLPPTQPPSRKPSSPAGSWMTPSRETLSLTTIFPMSVLLGCGLSEHRCRHRDVGKVGADRPPSSVRDWCLYEVCERREKGTRRW